MDRSHGALARGINRGAAVMRPRDAGMLADYVLLYCGLRVPRVAVCGQHQAPLEYLCHAFFEEPGDAVVWACRGGGKTQLAAVATLLDLVFKPQTQIRILGGSMEQSNKMYGYLRRLLGHPGLAPLLAEAPTSKGLALKNGSAVEVLAQSQSAVRGQRVQKVRCDEVELFRPSVWAAAQLTTRSLGAVRGRIEAISTYHVPGGLMEQLITPGGGLWAGAGGGGPASGGMVGGRKVMCWCIWDVMARCEAERSCGSCALGADCGGRGKEAAGFIPVGDLLDLQTRVSREVWETEMLCQRPRVVAGVFPGFDRARHVVLEAAGVRWDSSTIWIAGVDFGIRTFVCLWLRVSGEKDPYMRVVREWIGTGHTLGSNVTGMCALGQELISEGVIARRGGIGRDGAARVAGVEAVHCDHAGRQGNAQTGVSDFDTLEAAGLRVLSRPQLIEEGIGYIARMLEPADKSLPRLTVDPRCVRLIAALEGYRRDPTNGKPIKDGTHDHLIDALRYAICGVLGREGKTVIRGY